MALWLSGSAQAEVFIYVACFVVVVVVGGKQRVAGGGGGGEKREKPSRMHNINDSFRYTESLRSRTVRQSC